jgi:hypothetical protein
MSHVRSFPTPSPSRPRAAAARHCCWRSPQSRSAGCKRASCRAQSIHAGHACLCCTGAQRSRGDQKPCIHCEVEVRAVTSCGKANSGRTCWADHLQRGVRREGSIDCTAEGAGGQKRCVWCKSNCGCALRLKDGRHGESTAFCSRFLCCRCWIQHRNQAMTTPPDQLMLSGARCSMAYE